MIFSVVAHISRDKRAFYSKSGIIKPLRTFNIHYASFTGRPFTVTALKINKQFFGET